MTNLDVISGRLRTSVAELDCLQPLDQPAVDRLADDLAAAERHYRKQTQEGLEQALEHVPRLLRGRVRKMFES